MWDVIVVGAGLAGLTASVFLARAGRKVLLLEKSAQPGGRGMTKQAGGASLNLGAHALYADARKILREAGVEPTGASPKLNASLVFGAGIGGDKVVPALGLLLGSTLKWPEKTELIRFLTRINRLDTDSLQDVSLQRLLEKMFAHHRVRDLVQTFVRVSTYCNAPELVSAGAVFRQMQRSKILYVDGGWQTLADALKKQALKNGVTVRQDAIVENIAGRFPQMKVTLKDGASYSAHSVLSTAGPRETLAMLEAPLPASAAEAFRRLIPVRAACLDLVLNGLPNPKVNFSLGVERPLYFSNHSAAAKLTDTPGDAVVHVMKYLKPMEEPDSESDEREMEKFLDLIQPGWRNRVVLRRFLPHMTVSHGLVTADRNGLAGRPEPAVQSLPGLYVAGDWVGGEGMLLNAALASAKEAARRIMENTNKRENYRDGDPVWISK